MSFAKNHLCGERNGNETGVTLDIVQNDAKANEHQSCKHKRKQNEQTL